MFDISHAHFLNHFIVSGFCIDYILVSCVFENCARLPKDSFFCEIFHALF